MPALTFTLESDPAVFISLSQFYDLPKSTIGFGSKTRKKVTNYGGRNQRTIQVLGDEFDQIVLTGEWNDTKTGDRGRAERLTRSFEALRAYGQIVRLEWGTQQRWGILHFKADYKLLDVVNWTITFDVEFDRPPAFIRVKTYKTPPNDQASSANAQAETLSAFIDTAPDELNPSILLEFQMLIASIENDITDALSVLENVVASSELTVALSRRAVASLYAPILSIQQMRLRTKNATLEAISTVEGVKAIAVRRWTDEVDVLALTLRVTIASLILELIEAIRPVGDRRYAVKDTDTLMTIAANIFGDFSAWSAIADANDLESPFVAPGTVIILPNEV